VIRSGAFAIGDTRAELDRDFTFGLACILDGIDALIRRRGREGPGG
jgi:hypothetical protein